MSRRQDAAKTAQNQQTLKTLVKLESNKSCADCKRNKHPRWASWNLGVFICIRCSGIHRGMGTHISRVKSVDLDAWTDEQLQSMLKWGNARANKYFEAKLAAGHVPAETKIENFIRTKYESRRWVMDGPMPDPSTLDAEGDDDDVPLTVVQKQAKLDRSSAVAAQAAAQPPLHARKPTADLDLFGDPVGAPMSSQTPPPPVSKAAATTTQPSQRQVSGGQSLLGFDFFNTGSTSAPPSRPTSTAPATGSGPSRPDLKQSILSLYASAPRPASQQQSRPEPSRVQSPPVQTSSANGLADDFGGLTFNSAPSKPPPQTQTSAFANLTSPTSAFSSPRSSVTSPKPTIGTGSFFDPKPAVVAPPTSVTSPPPPVPAPTRGFSSSSGFGDWSSSSPIAPNPSVPKSSSGNGLSNDLFDFSSDPIPAATSPPSTLPQTKKQSSAPSAKASTSSAFDSPFNLSKPPPPAQASNAKSAVSSNTNTASFINDDPWGSSSAWASSQAPATTTPAASSATFQAPTLKSTPAAPVSSSDDWGGWNDSKPSAAPKVAEDEDFGGWESSTPAVNPPRPSMVSKPSNPAPTTNTNATTAKAPGGFGGDQDLFSNVWE